MTKKTYQFLDFILDTETGQFFYQKKAVPLSSKAFNILSYLIEHRGNIVEKTDIIESVWSDSFVEESNLAVHISAIRRILKSKHGDIGFIKTISGRGYSFIAPVKELNSFSESTPNSSSAASNHEKSNEPLSIAVLPFSFEKNTEDFEYLANGATRSLIDDLSQIPTLKVLAYSAVRNYRNSDLELPEIGFLLGADKILTGHISAYKNKFEITAELVNAVDKTHIWGMQQFLDSDDIFRVKKEISLSIAEKLKLKLTESNKKDFARQEQLNYEAQKLYFRGKVVLESRSTRGNIEETLLQALGFFRQAVKTEPNYALAYTGIGMVYVSLFNHAFLDKENAAAEVRKALQMALTADERLSQAYVLKGSFEVMFDRKFAEAEKSLDRAIELNPSNPDAYHWKGVIELCLGKFDKAYALETKAAQFDPTSMRFNGHLLRIHYFSGNYQKTIVLAEELLEFNSNLIDSFLFLSSSYAQLGFFKQALEYIEKTIEIRPISEFILLKGHILALLGKQSQAEQIISEVFRKFPENRIEYFYVAYIYSTLGKIDEAFEMLEKAFEKGSTELAIFKIDVRFKNLQNDPRYNQFLKKINLA